MDEQMARRQPCFPKSYGHKRVDDRRALSGIVFANRQIRQASHRSLPALSVQLKHPLLALLFARCTWANGELKAKFKHPFDRFHRFSVEIAEGAHALHASHERDRLGATSSSRRFPSSCSSLATTRYGKHDISVKLISVSNHIPLECVAISTD